MTASVLKRGARVSFVMVGQLPSGGDLTVPGWI